MKVSKRQLRRIIRETVRLHEANVPDNIQKIVMDAVEGFEEGFEVTEFHVHPSTGAWLIETATEDPDEVVPDFVDYLRQNETLSDHEINYDDWLIAIEPLDDADVDGGSDTGSSGHSDADSVVSANTAGKSTTGMSFEQVQKEIVNAAKQFNFKHAPIFDQDGEFYLDTPAGEILDAYSDEWRNLTAHFEEQGYEVFEGDDGMIVSGIEW